mgnify:CR=1 FL=1
MAKNQAPAKTPTVAIARVLRELGFKQGTDFRIKGEYRNGYRVGTYVNLYGADVRESVSRFANTIENRVAESGFTFSVSVRYFDGTPWPTVANYGDRVRDEAPAVTEPAALVVDHTTDTVSVMDGVDAVAMAVAPQPTVQRSGRMVVRDPEPMLSMSGQRAEAKRRGLVPDADPYDGLSQKRIGSLTWACVAAGLEWFFQNTPEERRYTLRYYRGRADVEGWYLSDNAGGFSFAGRSLTAAALVVEDIYLNDRKAAQQDPHGVAIAAVAAAWPAGTKASGRDSYGGLHFGTVREASVGAVVKHRHPNYGRVYVVLELDGDESRVIGLPWIRVFADTLTRA